MSEVFAPAADRPTPGAERRSSWAVSGLLGVALLGLVARVAVVAFSEGSNDLPTWEGFARAIDEHGLGWLYENDPVFNHPPLMGAMAWGLLKLSALTGVGFRWWFRLPSLLAECTVAALLWKRWRPGGPLPAAAAVALYGWNLDSILVAAFHGNTDVLVAAGCLAACAFLSGNQPLLGGLVLGAAINVKLVPVLLLPALILGFKDRRAFARFVVGLAVMALPFGVMLATHFAPFTQHVLGYASTWNSWGFGFLFERWVQDSGHAPVPVALQGAFVASGRWLPFVFSAAVGLVHRRFGRLEPYEVAALTLALFLIFTPGFAVQYTVFVGPLLFAVSVRWGALYGTAVGLFCAFIYYVFWTHTVPVYSLFTGGYPMAAARLGLYAWGVLIAFVLSRLYRLRPVAPTGPGGS